LDALEYFNPRFVYILQADTVVRLADLETYNPATFTRSQYANWLYQDGVHENGKPKFYSVAKKWMTSESRNQRDRMTYAPGQDRFCDGGKALNRWKCLGSQPEPGDVSLWNQLLDHLFLNAPEERKYFEQWLAYPLQHLGVKLKVAVVLYSKTQGVGKNILVEAVERIYGDNAVEIGNGELHDSFNPWQKDRQFIVGDQVQGGGDSADKLIEKLKRLITAPTVPVNEKFKPQFEIPNVANYIFLTNNCDALRFSDHDRRFWVWEIRRGKLDDAFYRRFHDWKGSEAGIAALHHHLLNVDTSDFNPDAMAPMTDSKQEMIEMSRNEPERWLLTLPDERPEATLWTLEDLVALFQHENARSHAGSKAIQKALTNLGFKRAYDGQLVRVGPLRLRFWVIAPTEEAERLLAIREPSELAKKYVAQTNERQPIDGSA
jgi:hypothetical protein